MRIALGALISCLLTACTTAGKPAAPDAALATPSSQAAPAANPAPVPARDVVIKGLKTLFVDFDPVAGAQLLTKDYIQHNPGFPTGAAPVLGFLPALKEAGLTAKVHRVLAQDDLVAIHSTYDNAQAFGGKTMVAFDVFRVDDGQIAEHWDNLQPVQPPNPSGHTMTDGPTEVTDLEKTEANEALVRKFVDVVLKGGDASTITDFVSTKSYVQHNPAVADGLDGLGAALKAFAEKGLTMVYTRTPLVVAEGNFVLTGSEGSFGGTPTAFYDLFRVEAGKIVEHWDVIAPIPEKMAHDNGKF